MLPLDILDLWFSPVPKYFLCGKAKVSIKKKWNDYGQKSVMIIFFVDTGIMLPF